MKSHSTEIRIERPGGAIEIVTKGGNMMHLVAAMTKATADAGRGKILSARLITTNVTLGCPSYTRDQGCPRHGETCR